MLSIAFMMADSKTCGAFIFLKLKLSFSESALKVLMTTSHSFTAFLTSSAFVGRPLTSTSLGDRSLIFSGFRTSAVTVHPFFRA